MTIGENIKFYREKKGLKRADVSRLTGISTQLLYKYEHDMSERITSGTVIKLCNALEVTPGDLLGWSPETFPVVKKSHTVPVYDKISGNGFTPSPAETDECVDVYDKVARHADELVAFRIGDAALLSEGIEIGDIAVIRKQSELEPNRFFAVVVDGGDATLRKIIFTNGGMTCYSPDPTDTPQEFSFQDLQDGRLKIIGKCVQIIRSFE